MSGAYFDSIAPEKGAISFTDFDIRPGHVEFTSRYRYRSSKEQENHRVFFTFQEQFSPASDLVAAAAITFCGRSFDSIWIDLPVSERTRKGLEGFTASEILAHPTSSTVSWDPPFSIGGMLNFSGGFDSLAAYCLMPPGTRLASLDFGGVFGREREFFSNFETFIVRTNLVETTLRKHSWTFMGIASILGRDHYESSYTSFGNILEASPRTFSPAFRPAKNGEVQPFSTINMRSFNFVNGITEVGTALILSHYRPQEMERSLVSLAPPGTEKLFRKALLAKIVQDRFGRRFSLPLILPPSKPPFRWGQNFAVDFLSLYIAKHLGAEAAALTLLGIPEDALNTTRTLSLRFFERVNPSLYAEFPPRVKEYLMQRCLDAGVLPYESEDWEEYTKVRKILQINHPDVA